MRIVTELSALQQAVGFRPRRVDARGGISHCALPWGQEHSEGALGCDLRSNDDAALTHCGQEEALEFLYHPWNLVKNVVVREDAGAQRGVEVGVGTEPHRDFNVRGLVRRDAVGDTHCTGASRANDSCGPARSSSSSAAT